MLAFVAEVRGKDSACKVLAADRTLVEGQLAAAIGNSLNDYLFAFSLKRLLLRLCKGWDRREAAPRHHPQAGLLRPEALVPQLCRPFSPPSSLPASYPPQELRQVLVQVLLRVLLPHQEA